MKIRTLRLLASALLIAGAALPPARAQLTTDQKVADFQAVAALYAKQYAPYDWKKTLFQYDAMDLAPWLAQVRDSATDLDYLDVLVRYVAALNDTHSTYRTVSDFTATLAFHADAYFSADRSSYRVLIDYIDPLLPYSFEIGDEIVSVDGTSASDLVAHFTPYMSAASEETRIRRAVAGITQRDQSWYPRASELGDNAVVVIRRQSGATETYTIPWQKSGVPLRQLGGARPVTVQAMSEAAPAAARRPVLERLRDLTDKEPSTLLGYGQRPPVWTLPSNFVLRLGLRSYDSFFSGVLTYQNYRIGYLRIPSFSPSAGTAFGLYQLDSEIVYLQNNTDALIVDVMRNPGGYACYVEDVMARLMPASWLGMGYQKRVTWADIDYLEEDLTAARAAGEDQQVLDLMAALIEEYRAAYTAGRLTNPVSLCDVTTVRSPAAYVYTRPALLLVDEFSTSGADKFSALFQDNGRGKLFGYRTNGAGGSVISETAGIYSEGGVARATESLMYRINTVAVDGYPQTHYIENVGVRPDIVFDYMRPEILAASGASFVQAFLAEIVLELQTAGIQPYAAAPAAAAPAVSAPTHSYGATHPQLDSQVE